MSDDLGREAIAPIRRTISGLGDGRQTRLIADTRLKLTTPAAGVSFAEPDVSES